MKKRIPILQHNLMRATMTLALIMTCATAWATDVQTYYIDENGTSYNVTATVLTGSETSIGTAGETTWYVVNSDITYNGKISYLGYPSLILADGKTMTVNNNGDEPAIEGNQATKLTIYGQTLGSGSLVASSTSGYAAIKTTGNIEIYGGHVSATGQRGIKVQYIYIKGGSVSATGTLQGITAWHFYVYGGQVTAMGGEGYNGIQSNYNISIGWRKTSDFITWNGYSSESHTVYIMDYKTFYAGATAYYDDGNGIGVSIPDGTVTLRPYSSDDLSVNEAGTEYTIHTAAGWGYFCDAIDGGESFSGKTVKLDADISVSHCAGSGTDEEHAMDEHPFCGTFNGQGYKITFNYGDPNDPLFGSSGNPSTEDYIAPFRYVKNATIEHLHIDGTINTCHKHSAGLVGLAYGTTHITDCRSSINIRSYIAGTDLDGTHGGIMACSWTGSTTYITGCVFDGSIQSATGYTTDQCGGFVGWKNGTINVTNCLLTATFTNIGVGTGSYPSATFVRHGVANDITNSYYVTALGTLQGKERHSITADENVIVGFIGTANEYETSGITAYKDGNTQLPGLLYNNNNNQVLYAGNGDVVSLTLNHSNLNGYTITDYSASAGTLENNVLTMPDENVTITATLAPIDWATESEGDAEHPYMIYNKDQLNLLAYRVNGTHGEPRQSDGYSGKYFKLGADITYSHEGLNDTESNYEAIGGYYDGNHRYFKGHFDGDGHTVSGIRIYKGGTDRDADCYQGLFSRIKDNANIHDVTLADAYITGYLYLGGIAGDSKNSNITRCHVTSTVTIKANPFDSSWHGGIVGEASTGSNVTHCTSAATLTFTSSSRYYGAITGYVYFGTLSDNLVIGATVPAVYRNSYGAICGHNNNGTLARNYYYNCTMAGVQNAIGMGCGNEGYSSFDLTANDGAVPGNARTVEGYGESEKVGWTFIASPLTGNTDPATAAVQNIFSATEYDLYRLRPSDTMWQNYKQAGDHYHFQLQNGRGYLYATQQQETVKFIGENNAFNIEDTKNVPLPQGFNLVGNPFPRAAYINKPYYTLNPEGSAVVTEASTGYISPCTGVVVQVENGSETLTFRTTPFPEQGTNNNGNLNIALTQTVNPSDPSLRGGTTKQSSTIDNAIVSFNEGSQLGKFYFGTQNANLYLPQGAEEYAITYSDGYGEMPVNFRANENGQYTITVNPEGVEMAYLHLIDNLTGADVDLLATNGGDARPVSTYTFNAKTTDYENRFKLVFATNDEDGPSTGSGTFAFFSNGNIIVNGEGLLQVIDVMGRVIVSGDAINRVSTGGMTAGVYVLRLINGENVKVQKVVIE